MPVAVRVLPQPRHHVQDMPYRRVPHAGPDPRPTEVLAAGADRASEVVWRGS
ncbi:hypothetical protein AB0D59_49030 [Streptomyces sp. NPDC048417]|uniref:hypothetical protein n=1 Tax=Streptomyces sp. NPDC048417 TaxID=3155387 RepID=UPI00343E23B4